jgi:hypothetical protein
MHRLIYLLAAESTGESIIGSRKSKTLQKFSAGIFIWFHCHPFYGNNLLKAE